VRIDDYFDTVERQFLLSPIVLSFHVREREERPQEGFIRIRARLSNGDLLEAFEFVVAMPDGIETQTYRMHWQGEDGGLRRRWDNAPHHQGISTFPHQVHLSPERVASSDPMTIVKVLAFLEEEFQRHE
jgi:hypothetical protein